MYDGDILSGLNWRLNLIALSFSVSGAYLASVSYENRKSKCFYVNLRFLPGCEKLRKVAWHFWLRVLLSQLFATYRYANFFTQYGDNLVIYDVFLKVIL